MENEFGQTMRKVRLQKGYSLKDFAQWCGISPTYLNMVETGKTPVPTDEKVTQMADLLGMHRDDAMCLAGRPRRLLRKRRG